MRRMMLVALAALPGCGSGSQAPTPDTTPATAATTPSPAPVSAPAAPSAVVPTPTSTPTTRNDVAVLESRDCRTVAQAYAAALAHNDFAFAARVWNDPVVDAARLKARFAAYAIPQIEITKVSEEGAAGSLYCTVTGKLTDTGSANKLPVQGEIVLRRVNDVPGATPDQLRWTIQSSTFIEKLERSNKGGAT